MTQAVDPCVLIVDDDPQVLDILTRTVKDHRFVCASARTLQEARLIAQQDEIDLVVVDVALSDGSGLDLLKSLRCTHPSIPVIVITGYPSTDLASDALRLGAFDLLEKPFETTTLVEVLSEASACRRRQIANVRDTLCMMAQPAAFVDRARRLLTANRHWEELFGPVDGRAVVDAIVAAESPVTIGDLIAATEGTDRTTAQVALVSQNVPHAAEATVIQMRERRDQPGGYLVSLTMQSGAAGDVSVEVSRDADSLTGCLTHSAFFRAMELMRSETLRRSLPVSLLLIDVNDLRAINQTQGYEVADQALQNLAHEIRGVVRDEDLVGRYSGDQFIVALREATAADAEAVAERLCSALANRSYDQHGTSLPLNVTVGVTECPAGYTTTNRELAEQARAAVIWGRRSSGGPVIRYNERMQQENGRLSMDQEEIERLTQEFAEVNESLRAAYIESAQALVAAVEAKDPYTRRHGDATAAYAEQLACELNLPEPMRRSMRYAALLHDVGKIGIPDHILTKPGSLTAAEFELIKQHPIIGANIVSQISFMRREVPIIQHHHENWDGSGYPAGIGGQTIPLGARVLRVADSFDTMLSARSYKKPFNIGAAITEIVQGKETLYDPRVVEALESLVHRSGLSLFASTEVAAVGAEGSGLMQ
ncbi:MAG: response regulator [Planctomycetes bacterium]|nr:response regulator [Planctomycetota bacterium]